MTTPEGLDPTIRTRGIVFEADVQGVTPFLKVATAHRGGAGHMTFACDEGPSLRRPRLGAHAAHVLQRRARLLTDDPGVPLRAHAQGRR